MEHKRMAMALALVALVGLVGCGKKPAPVTTPPPPAAVTQPTPEVTPTPTPPTTSDPTPTPRPKSLEELEHEAREAGLFGDVYFDFDRYELRAEARQHLERNAQFMRDNPGLVFTIEGHCDDRGTNEYNIALGQRRASTASDFIQSLGIQGSRLKSISYGEERPVCTESSEGCWQRNRRAKFVISGRR